MKSAQHNIAFAIALVSGVLVFHRDWLVVLSGGTLFSDDYYEVFFPAYRNALVVAFFLSLFGGRNSIVMAAGLMLPSLLLRHAAFLWQTGPTNTWPPFFVADLILSSLAILPCMLGSLFRRKGLSWIRRYS